MKTRNLLFIGFLLFVQVAQTEEQNNDWKAKLIQDFVEIETVDFPRVVAGSLVIEFPQEIDFERKKNEEIKKLREEDPDFKLEKYQPTDETFFGCFRIPKETYTEKLMRILEEMLEEEGKEEGKEKLAGILGETYKEKYVEIQQLLREIHEKLVEKVPLEEILRRVFEGMPIGIIEIVSKIIPSEYDFKITISQKNRKVLIVEYPNRVLIPNEPELKKIDGGDLFINHQEGEDKLYFYLNSLVRQGFLKEGSYSLSFSATISDEHCIGGTEASENTKDENTEDNGATITIDQPIKLKDDLEDDTEFTIFDVREDGSSIIIRFDSVELDDYEKLLENCQFPTDDDECNKNLDIRALLKTDPAVISQTIVPLSALEEEIPVAFHVINLMDLYKSNDPPIESCKGGLVRFTPSLLGNDGYEPGFVAQFSRVFALSEDFGGDGVSRPGIGRVASLSSSPRSLTVPVPSPAPIICDPNKPINPDGCVPPPSNQPTITLGGFHTNNSPGGRGMPVTIYEYRGSLGLDANFPYKGAGIIIAILDTGVTNTVFNRYEDFNENTAASLEGRSFVSSKPDNHGSCDPNGDCFDNLIFTPAKYDFGHGTAVALLAAGGTSAHPVGIAPNANILPVTVCDSKNRCQLENLVQGICYALNEAKVRNNSENAHDQPFNNLVINLSLSKYDPAFQAPLLNKVLGEAAEGGAIIVASAGDVQDICEDDYASALSAAGKEENVNLEEIKKKYDMCVKEPQPYSNRDFNPAAIKEYKNDKGETVPIEGMITVGALSFHGNQFFRQQYTPSVDYIDVYAPGCVSIAGLFSDIDCELNPLNGTSFATGLISGVAALLRQAYPEKSAGEIAQMLSGNRNDFCIKGRDDTYCIEGKHIFEETTSDKEIMEILEGYIPLDVEPNVINKKYLCARFDGQEFFTPDLHSITLQANKTSSLCK
jgi:subtilisin family serine protease